MIARHRQYLPLPTVHLLAVWRLGNSLLSVDIGLSNINAFS